MEVQRLGRNYGEIIEQWRIISKVKKCDIKVLGVPLLDTKAYRQFLVQGFAPSLRHLFIKNIREGA